MTWKNNKYLFLGKNRVGVVHYDGFTSQKDPKKFKAVSNLPGVPEYLGHFEFEIDAKRVLEIRTELWIHDSGLKESI